jgi:predicted ATP-grasp superfamily ATP-dependent carboligase
MQKILILDAGEAPYSVVAARSLGSAGHIVDLGFPYGAHFFDAYSKYCKNHLFYPDPVYAQNDFIKFFKALAGKYDFIIPTMEKTQLPLSAAKEYIEKKGTNLPIPNHEILSIATNKKKVLEISKKNKITLPKTMILTEEPAFNEIIKEIGLPFIMKASTEINVPVGPSSRYFVIEHKIAQEDFRIKFNQLAKLGPVILQQYIKGIGIGASFIFSKDNNLITFFGHKRILERFPEGGPSVIAETYFHPEAIIQGYRLLRALNWQGIAMTEFKLSHDGKLYFMEVNPRFWGTLPLAIASGIDFPKILVEHYDKTKQNVTFRTVTKKKIFVNGTLLLYLFLASLKGRKLHFAKEIGSSGLKIFSHGFPFVANFEKLDLLPEIKQLSSYVYTVAFKGRISNVGNIFFGPAMPYKKILRRNITAIIDLREELEKTSTTLNNKIRLYNFPIKDDSAPDLKSFFSIISIIDKLVEVKKEKVYIHCRLGRGRAPMVVIAYLISKKVPINEAYTMVYDARPYAYLNLIQKEAIYNFYKSCFRH